MAQIFIETGEQTTWSLPMFYGSDPWGPVWPTPGCQAGGMLSKCGVGPAVWARGRPQARGMYWDHLSNWPTSNSSSSDKLIFTFQDDYALF